ncbi:MAG TPA: hypothetical protein VFC23_10255 [Thermoanaerobaculia bacterium]|nr:hypothetical protein [Thermoanaerobaculia bacterium]
MALVEDARTLAWAYLGNAFRIASNLRRADEALCRDSIWATTAFRSGRLGH